jgi:hypothetical protein
MFAAMATGILTIAQLMAAPTAPQRDASRLISAIRRINEKVAIRHHNLSSPVISNRPEEGPESVTMKLAEARTIRAG